MSALAGKTVAISISDAPDRAKLGFPAREVERTIFTLCTALIRAGARILYAGDLRPDGWTFKMFRHLAGLYAGRQDTPFIHLIPEPAARAASFGELLEAARQGRGVADSMISIGGRLRQIYPEEDVLLLDPNSERARLPDADTFAAWLNACPEEPPLEALSRARRLATQMTHARIAMGGKCGQLDVSGDVYQGAMPGIGEEAILALEAGAAFVPLGAFGGATRDVAIALDLLPESARVPRGRQQDSYGPAMARLAGMRSAIPGQLRDRLRALAGCDQTEWLAQATVGIVADWRQEI